MRLNSQNAASTASIKAGKRAPQFSGVSGNRPANVRIGFMYFDTDLNKPIWKGNNGWVDANGDPADGEQL